MSTETESLLSVLFAYSVLVLGFLCTFWKRKEPYLQFLVGLGIIFHISVASWDFLQRHRLLTQSDVFSEDYGVVLGSFFRDGYFVYFHVVLLIAYGYLILTRLRSR